MQHTGILEEDIFTEKCLGGLTPRETGRGSETPAAGIHDEE